MPEATVNKDHLAAFAEHKVGPTWQRLDVNAITEAHRVDEAANERFRFRVLVADPTHAFAAFNLRESIHIRETTDAECWTASLPVE